MFHYPFPLKPLFGCHTVSVCGSMYAYVCLCVYTYIHVQESLCMYLQNMYIVNINTFIYIYIFIHDLCILYNEFRIQFSATATLQYIKISKFIQGQLPCRGLQVRCSTGTFPGLQVAKCVDSLVVSW